MLKKIGYARWRGLDYPVWEIPSDIDTEEKRSRFIPVTYLEQFRTINRQEFDCIKVSAVRGRIPVDDPLFVTVGRLIQVSYSCNSQGITTCVILCRAADNTHLFTGVSRLNPSDSYNRKKGEALAFYRAVVESETLTLPVELSFALTTKSL